MHPVQVIGMAPAFGVLLAGAVVLIASVITLAVAKAVNRRDERRAAPSTQTQAEHVAAIVAKDMQSTDAQWVNTERELFAPQSTDMSAFERMFTLDEQRKAQRMSLLFSDRQMKR
jgi:hypothetical protein